MAWWIPFNKLRDRQTRYVDEMVASVEDGRQTTYWVKGFAGTGKTTVLSNLAVKLRGDRKHLNLNERYCFITYTHAMKNLLNQTFTSENKGFIYIQTHTKFLKENRGYDFVFLDEVQDISPSDLQKIKDLSKFIFIAGDCEQTIYSGSATEPQIDEVLNPKKMPLTEILRLTKAIRDIAKSILTTSNIQDGSPENTNGNSSPYVVNFDNEQQEFDWLIKDSVERAAPYQPSCILFSHHDDIKRFFYHLYQSYDDIEPKGPFENIHAKLEDRLRWYHQVNGFFNHHKKPFRYLGNNEGELADSDKAPLVYVMTYHSAKGLDFDNVYIPQLNSNKQLVYPFVLEKEPDLDKRLMFVAITRSRKELFLSYSSAEPHNFIKNLPKNSYQAVDNPQKLDEDVVEVGDGEFF